MQRKDVPLADAKIEFELNALVPIALIEALSKDSSKGRGFSAQSKRLLANLCFGPSIDVTLSGELSVDTFLAVFSTPGVELEVNEEEEEESSEAPEDEDGDGTYFVREPSKSEFQKFLKRQSAKPDLEKDVMDLTEDPIPAGKKRKLGDD